MNVSDAALAWARIRAEGPLRVSATAGTPEGLTRLVELDGGVVWWLAVPPEAAGGGALDELGLPGPLVEQPNDTARLLAAVSSGAAGGTRKHRCGPAPRPAVTAVFREYADRDEGAFLRAAIAAVRRLHGAGWVLWDERARIVRVGRGSPRGAPPTSPCCARCAGGCLLHRCPSSALVLVLVHSVAIPRSAGTLDRDGWASTHPTAVEELYRYSQLPRTEVRAALARLRAAGLVLPAPERGRGRGQGGAYLPGPQLQRLTPTAAAGSGRTSFSPPPTTRRPSCSPPSCSDHAELS